MFKTFTCSAIDCGRLFTYPCGAYEVPTIDGKPAHPSCSLRHYVKKRLKEERIEYLMAQNPETDDESIAIQQELLRLCRKEGDPS